MSYRDPHLALRLRTEALERELADREAELARLRNSPSPPPPAQSRFDSRLWASLALALACVAATWTAAQSPEFSTPSDPPDALTVAAAPDPAVPAEGAVLAGFDGVVHHADGAAPAVDGEHCWVRVGATPHGAKADCTVTVECGLDHAVVYRSPEEGLVCHVDPREVGHPDVFAIETVGRGGAPRFLFDSVQGHAVVTGAGASPFTARIHTAR